MQWLKKDHRGETEEFDGGLAPRSASATGVGAFVYNGVHETERRRPTKRTNQRETRARMVQTPNSFLFGFRRDRIPLWLWTLDFGGGAEQSRAGGNEKGGLVCLTRLQELLCCHGAPKEEAARREEEQQSMAAF
jgi:hypothetical protein